MGYEFASFLGHETPTFNAAWLYDNGTHTSTHTRPLPAFAERYIGSVRSVHDADDCGV